MEEYVAVYNVTDGDKARVESRDDFNRVIEFYREVIRAPSIAHAQKQANDPSALEKVAEMHREKYPHPSVRLSFVVQNKGYLPDLP